MRKRRAKQTLEEEVINLGVQDNTNNNNNNQRNNIGAKNMDTNGIRSSHSQVPQQYHQTNYNLGSPRIGGAGPSQPNNGVPQLTVIGRYMIPSSNQNQQPPGTNWAQYQAMTMQAVPATTVAGFNYQMSSQLVINEKRARTNRSIILDPQEADKKKMDTLIKNRLSAARSRTRQQEYLRNLEERAMQLEEENAQLKKSLEEERRIRLKVIKERGVGVGTKNPTNNKLSAKEKMQQLRRTASWRL